MSTHHQQLIEMSQVQLKARSLSPTDYFTVSGAPSFFSTFTYPFTIAGWVRMGDFSGASHVFACADASVGNQMVFCGTNVDNARGWVRDTSSPTTIIDAGVPTDDEWAHVCLVGKAANDHELFLNGVSVGTNTTSATPSGLDTSTIGRISDSTPTSTNTGTDACDVAVWDRALSDAEILFLGTGKVRPETVSGGSPEHYWAMQETSGDLTDTGSTGGLNMTAVSSPASVSDGPIVAYTPP